MGRRLDGRSRTPEVDPAWLDTLLAELHHLRELEERRRTLPVSSPAFDRAADEAVTVSRRIFELAREDELSPPDETDEEQPD